jgi:hypothetical protein
MATQAENDAIPHIRNWRDKLLEDTSHWEGSGTTAQLAYRQSLTDIEDQPDFPSDVTWPIKPV